MRNPFRPKVVLVKPQMGENIGAAARAMANFGFTEMRLVCPRDGWPNSKATAMAAGANHILDKVQLFDSLQDALADCHYAVATTARIREQNKRVLEPSELGEQLASFQGNSAVVFGPERSGLENDDIACCHDMLRIPVAPDFASLNLAQSVLLICYELFRFQPLEQPKLVRDPVAPLHEYEGMIGQLSDALDMSGFFYPEEKKASMVRNLRGMFLSVGWSSQQIRTMRGVIRSLQRGHPQKQPDD